MTKFTIELPATHVVTSRGKHVTVDVGGLKADIIARLVLHGLTQKIGDAAAGAKAAAGEGADEAAIADTGHALMQKVAATLAAGEWGVERGGNGVSAEHAEMRTILRPLVKAKFSNWREMDEKARVAAIDAALGNLSDEQRAKVEAKAKAELKRKAKEAEAAKALAAELGDLDLGAAESDDKSDSE